MPTVPAPCSIYDTLALHGNHVSVTVNYADERAPATIRAKYLIGCDGPRSTVRSLLGLQYVGTAGEKPDGPENQGLLQERLPIEDMVEQSS
jgi:2-polyprenyl-6-methoxyphenol hydroxylase-like FAD-dependent oxidoreductase